MRLPYETYRVYAKDEAKGELWTVKGNHCKHLESITNMVQRYLLQGYSIMVEPLDLTVAPMEDEDD